MRQEKIKILDVNPHNVFLAEEPVKWLNANYKQIEPIDVCVYNNDIMTDDGDHRLYVFFRKGRIYTPANIYDLNDEQDLNTLQELKEKQNLEYMAKEVGKDIEWVKQNLPKGARIDIKTKFEQDLEFIRSLGINSIADLAKREILKTTADIQEAYWRLKKDFNERRR